MRELEQLKVQIRKDDFPECEHCGEMSSESARIKEACVLRFEFLTRENLKLKRELEKLEKTLDIAYVPINSSDFETIERLKAVELERKVLRAQKE